MTYTRIKGIIKIERNGMIKTCKDKETERIYDQKFSRKLPNSIQKTALRKLMMIDNAETLEDLKISPANRVETTKEDRSGQHSIRINDQYRICFKYKDGDFYDVEITDYH